MNYVSVEPTNESSSGFQWRSAVYDIPSTNPFLRSVFSLIAGHQAEHEPFIGFVDDLAQLLAHSDMQAILSDFGKRGARQDPVMHFYETFLAAYDPARREKRGVYYTPEPVVQYIVRSVDHILKENFSCPEGLADYQTTEYEVFEQTDNQTKAVKRLSHRVLVLDPACGTGSFLYAVIDQIRNHYRSNGMAGMWNGYVREHLLNRIFGFEIMMAPYAMAHLKLELQIAALDVPEKHRADWSYRFASDERLGIYLTNALEEAAERVEGLFGPMRIIAQEADAASEIKRDLPIMVVLGNPPYSGHSANASRREGKLTWIGKLIEDYKTIDGAPLGEKNPKWLQDDYVKFIRFGQWRIEQSGAGILAFITNHSWLDNPTFRGMRQQLIDTFTDIYFVKEPNRAGPARVHHSDLWGERQAKYQALAESDIATTRWEQLEPRSPNYIFKPWDNELEDEYGQWMKITEIMPTNSVGIVTGRDGVAIQWSSEEMKQVAFEAGIDVKDELVSPILYRPFDTRHTYYSRDFITRLRDGVMRHMQPGGNLGLTFMRQVALHDDYSHFGVSRAIVDNRAFYSNKGITSFAPLYIYPSKQEIEQGLYKTGDREPNLSPSFIKNMEQALGMRCINDGRGDLYRTFGPEDALHYIYAVFHSPEYRERYDQFLRADFPRVPLTDDVELFRELTGLGQRLTAVHLMETSAQDQSSVRYPVSGDDVIEKGHPKYVAPGNVPPGQKAPIKRGRVYISRDNQRSVKRGQYFDGIAPDVWKFRVGGYQPLDKWIRDRRGRALSFDELIHYRSIVVSVEETIRLVAEIDRAIADSSGDLLSVGSARI